LSSEHEIPSLEHEVPSSEHEVPSSEHEVPSSEHEVPSSEHEVPSSEHEVPSSESDRFSFIDNTLTLEEWTAIATTVVFLHALPRLHKHSLPTWAKSIIYIFSPRRWTLFL
jgi:hypothetical protein